MPAVSAAYRIGQVLIVALIVWFLASALIRLVPGDPAVAILGARATPENLAALRIRLGLEDSFIHASGRALLDLLQGNLGTSLTTGQPVLEMALPALGITLVLVAISTIVAIMLGIPLGLFAALSRSRSLENAVAIISAMLLATPPVIAALVLLLFVAVQAGIAPPGGWPGAWPQNAGYVWLPSLALALPLIPYITNTVRRAASEAIAEPFYEAAVARGIPTLRIATRHVLPSTFLPLITVIGYNVSVLIGGAVIVEAIFNIPGIGGLLTRAVAARDIPVLQGAAFLTGLLVVSVNFASDILYRVVDPRVRLA